MQCFDFLSRTPRPHRSSDAETQHTPEAFTGLILVAQPVVPFSPFFEMNQNKGCPYFSMVTGVPSYKGLGLVRV